jgi:outer membrane scaffolding protein for murein synthesis (MipA/OmpV family)
MKMSRLFLAGLLAISLGAAPAWAMEHTFGLGAGFAPDYEGSEDSQGVPMLMLKGSYDSGRSFTLMGPNLRVNVVPSKLYSFGPVLNYRMERGDVDNNRVDAMKNIDSAFEAGIFGGIDMSNWLLGAELLADVSNEHDGLLAKLSAGYRWKAAADLTVTPRVFTTFADDDYMDTYFGVNSGNRGSSGLPDFKADSGLKDVGVNLVVNYTPWENWGIMGLLSYSALLNDAKDSPIVDDEGDDKQMYFGLMGTYRWGSK